MVQLLTLYIGISTALAVIFAVGVAAAPRGSRAELATWGAVIASLWFAFLVALAIDTLVTAVTRLALRLKRR